MLVFIWLATIFAVVFSYKQNSKKTLDSLSRSFKSLKSLMPGLIGMIAAVGLAIAAIPEVQILRLFSIHGLRGFVLVSLAGSIVTIPGPIAFPLAGALLKMGVPPSSLASFITTLTMVGIVTAPLEASYFGSRFVIYRQLLSFAGAVVIGMVMGFFL